MKPFLAGLKVGDLVVADVIEATGGNDFIVNFHGDLIRIANHSGKNLTLGEKVSLVVTSIRPFSFRLYGMTKQSLDRHI